MIEVDKLSMRLGTFNLDGISFSVPSGAYAALMGKTGVGKTSVLEAICGLKPTTGGTVRLAGRDVTQLRPADRGIGFVPQDAALFSTMTVRDQLGFSLAVRRRPKQEIAARVGELAARLGIESLLDRRPPGLSGGEKQRVALGRALAFRPRILCLDEPLSALDEDTREDLCELLRDLTRESGVTTLHITHNRTEARALADVHLQLQGGEVVEQVDKRGAP